MAEMVAVSEGIVEGRRRPEQARGRSSLADIDMLRGMAALIVVAYHTRETTWVGIREFWNLHGPDVGAQTILGYVTFPLVWGSIGVPIFFVLSGYCIHRSQAFARARSGSFQLSPTNFLVRRFLRIYPVLVGALFLTLLCDSMSRRYFPNSSKLGDTGIDTFLVNLFSLQGIGGPTYGSNVPLWTLSIEVQLYALYPLLLAIMWRIGNLWTLMLLLAINIVSYFALRVHGEVFSSYYVSWYLGALVAEGEAASTLSGKLTSPRFHAGVYAFGFAILCAGCAVFFLDSYIAFQVWAVGFAVLLFGLRKGKGTMRSWWSRIFQWLGTFSYSIYIVHLPVVVLLHSIVFNSVKQVSIAPFYATLIAVIGCAYAFSFICEKPALAFSQMLKIGTRRHSRLFTKESCGVP